MNYNENSEKGSHLQSRKMLLLTVDHHFIRTPDGKVWVEGIHDAAFWQKYLFIFDKVYALVRMKTGQYKDVQSWILSSYRGVEFIDIPYFQGPKEYAKKYLSVKMAIRKAVKIHDITCGIFRVPSTIGFAAMQQFSKTGKPVGVEVVSDLTQKSFYHYNVLVNALLHLMSRQLQRACRTADGVAYVTESAIQKNNPPNPSGFTTNYSSIDLLPDFYFKRPETEPKKEYCIVHVSTLNEMTKGHKTLFNTIKIVREKGYNVTVTIIGGGRYQSLYEYMAKELELESAVSFTGHVGSKEQIRRYLMKADMFVFPSEAEGLPRVLLEAMACSLPCVSTPVGGISELLEDHFMLDPLDVEGFAKRIIELIENPALMKRQSERNYSKALEYEYSALMKKRKVFFEKLITVGER